MTMRRFIEEPYVVKITRTDLKTSGYREVLAEFTTSSKVSHSLTEGVDRELYAP